MLLLFAVRYVTPLCDAWVEANGTDGGETSETPSNSYTHRLVFRKRYTRCIYIVQGLIGSTARFSDVQN